MPFFDLCKGKKNSNDKCISAKQVNKEIMFGRLNQEIIKNKSAITKILSNVQNSCPLDFLTARLHMLTLFLQLISYVYIFYV